MSPTLWLQFHIGSASAPQSRIRAMSGWLILVVMAAAGCSTSDNAIGGPALDGGEGGGGGGGDGGSGGLCGDGVCDPLESAESCPLDCGATDGGGGPKTPFECIQAACQSAVIGCATHSQCAQTLGCIASCGNAGCLGECRQKAYVNGFLPAPTSALFDCVKASGCTNGGGSQCGDGICEPGEASACPADCGGTGPVCGDGVCEEGEDAASCVMDCGSVGPICGNGLCQFGEDAKNCATDCQGGPNCGDGQCEDVEWKTCPADCVTPGPTCGNQKCEPGENQATCPQDCQPSTVCGDGACSAGETAQSCPGDCAKPVCGDGICSGSEGPGSCAKDCGSDPLSCAKEKCSKQVAVCLADPACAGLFKCFGSCQDDACYQVCVEKAGDQALPAFMPLAECGNKLCTGFCGDGTCGSGESTKTCAKDCPAGPSCGNGACEPGETSQSCPMDCGSPKPVCGNGVCEAGETGQNCPKDCADTKPVCGNGVCETGENPFACAQDCSSPKPVCGNGLCEFGESNQTCPKDCAPPKPACGNGFCETGESSQTCPKDCGAPNLCGNSKCDAGESPQTCPSDCFDGGSALACAKKACETQYNSCAKAPACAKALESCVVKCKDFACMQACALQNQAALQQLLPLAQCADKAGCLQAPSTCGNGKCDAGEAQSCPQDCVTPGPICGDGKCGIGEAQTCPKDCMTPGPVCGNGQCEQGESSTTCPADCGQPQPGTCKDACGSAANACFCDEICYQMGDCCPDFKQYCPQLVPVCGDGKCAGETPQTCPQDCKGPTCGDGKCEDGEQQSCPQDCPKPTVCGDGVCAEGEQNTCPKDCQPVKACQKKSDCASTEVCCNGSKGQICVPTGQCF